MHRRAAPRGGLRPRQTMSSAVRLAAIDTATGARVCGTALDFDIVDPKEPEVCDQLRRCADSLSAVGVRLAIEFLPYSCVATVSDAWELCDAVGWDAAGLLVDSWHTSVSGQVGSVHGLAADDIAMVQYSDGVLPTPRTVQDDSRNHRRMPGCGQFDLHGFVAAIVRTGYDGIISPEVLSADVRVAIRTSSPPNSIEHSASTGRARSAPSPDWSVLGSARFLGLVVERSTGGDDGEHRGRPHVAARPSSMTRNSRSTIRSEVDLPEFRGIVWSYPDTSVSRAGSGTLPRSLDV